MQRAVDVSVEWETPAWLFERLDAEFHFTLDVCAEPWNAKVEPYLSPEDDALERAWPGVCWMNPPYGAVLRDWIAKAWAASQCGATVVCLLPARTDTAWFHDFVLQAEEIRFVRGRLRFGGAPAHAPFPSIVVVFRPRRAGARPQWPRLGIVELTRHAHAT
jgi:site-specific DNA-methyltransferase (adenine-specific)